MAFGRHLISQITRHYRPTTFSRWSESNRRMAAYEAAAVPLGDTAERMCRGLVGAPGMVNLVVTSEIRTQWH